MRLKIKEYGSWNYSDVFVVDKRELSGDYMLTS